MGTLTRTTWTDDDGSGRTGSIINNTELQAIYAAVEADLKSANFPSVTTKSIQDLMLGGEVFDFGGDVSERVTLPNYLSGATHDKCHIGTSFLAIDAALLTGTYKIQAMGRLAGAATTLSIAIMNLSDGSPDTAMATITIDNTGAYATGKLGTSGAITFPAAGASKTYGIKTKVDAGEASAWRVRLIRTA